MRVEADCMTSMGLERLHYSLYFKMVVREPGPGQVGREAGGEVGAGKEEKAVG